MTIQGASSVSSSMGGSAVWRSMATESYLGQSTALARSVSWERGRTIYHDRGAGASFPGGTAVAGARAAGDRRYLGRHPDMHDLIRDLAEAAQERLYGNALSLEVHHDPEFRDDYLAFYVRPSAGSRYPRSDIQRLLAPFADARGTASGWFTFLPDHRVAV